MVILGHELWHMRAGHRGHHHVQGAEVATRLLGHALDEDALRTTVLKVAARTRFDLAEEKEAEAFGLLLASKCRTRLAGSSLRGPVRRDRWRDASRRRWGIWGRRAERARPGAWIRRADEPDRAASHCQWGAASWRRIVTDRDTGRTERCPPPY
ncbi:hypothetical protein GCM10023238_03550 [Streptomyces heliomycini]